MSENRYGSLVNGISWRVIGSSDTTMLWCSCILWEVGVSDEHD